MATATIAAVVNSAIAIPLRLPSGWKTTPLPPSTTSSSSDISEIATMPIPEMGLYEEPTNPAM